MVTYRKDVEAWWEAMMECASNTYQSSLRELHFIDGLPRLSLNPLAALCCLCTNKWAKHTSQAWSSGNFYWFDPCSWFTLVWKKALQGNCSDQSSKYCACVVVMSFLRYADIPASSTYCDYAGGLCSLSCCGDWQLFTQLRLFPLLNVLSALCVGWG